MSELHKFLFEGLPVRGMLVRLTDSWQELLARREKANDAFPAPVRTLLGDLPPDSGEVVRGFNTRIAFLDQGRSELNDANSVLEEVAGDNDHVILEDGAIHVRSFLRLMLFDDRFADAKVSTLSGGERNRVQLAKLLRRGGNLLVLDDGRIGFLDFGIIGRLSIERRRQIASYLMSFATKDFVLLAKTMTQMGVCEGKLTPSEWERFARDLEEAFSPFLGGSVQAIDYSQVIPKMIRISRKHGTRLPSDFVLVTRQLLYFDRYARLLAPTLNLFADPRLMMTIGAELMML